MSTPVSDHQIAAVRAFNRFYTKRLGVLEQHLYDSPFSLTEARVLYELAQRDYGLAKEIGAGLGLDAGYLSRIVQNFEDKGLINRKAAPEDRRQQRLSLTAKGRTAFERINRRSHDDIAAMLGQLASGCGERLVQRWAASSDY
jgi:DNA-binding MarR family transcriptional regulator